MSISQTSALASEQLNVRFPVEKYTLKNGLTVLLHRDTSIPMISYHTWYRVGSRDESVGLTGAAHMLEHMMFKGAKKYSGKDFDHILHQNGITNNAFTSWDYTGFYQNLPSHRLELMMDMEVDRMRYLALSESDLKSELQVVAEERRWRIDNNPMGLLREELFAKIFNGSSYSWPVIGFMKDILNYKSEGLRFFYDTYYVPNNAVLVIAGDFDISNAKALIEKYYGPLEPKQLEKRAYPSVIKSEKPVRSVLKKDVQNVTFMLAYPTVTVHEDDSVALDILGSILGGGASSRLYSRLVYQEQIATSAGAFQLSNDASGLFGISVSLRPVESSEKAEKMVREEVKKLLASGVEEKEVTKAKNQIMKEFVDSLQTLDGRARALATNEILFGSYERLFSDLARYQKVTPQKVLEVAKRYLDNKSEVYVGLLPKKY
jgi:zinc protease